MKSARSLICCALICLLSLFVFPINSLVAHAYSPVRVELPINCLDVEDYDNHIYKIVIEPLTERAPMPVSDSLYIDENENDIFELCIDEPGTYIYRIYEPKGDALDIEYESREYEATLFVETNDKDELLPALYVTVDGEPVKSAEIHFQDEVLSGGDKKTTTSTTTTTITTTTNSLTSTNNTTTTTINNVSSTTTIATTSTKSNPIVSFVDTVMTGDNMPLRLLCTIIAVSALLMFAALIFKKKED